MARPATPAEPAAAPGPARAFGRSLADFGALSPAEKTLLHCCRRGEIAVIAEERPEEETDANRVRASFFRFLALGGDENAPVHERGVELKGAWLTGALDLNATRIEHWLSLWRCRIEGMQTRHSTFKLLSLVGSRLIHGLQGDGLHCEGDVLLREGFHATGGVRLIGATIGGDLSCGGARFENVGGPALSLSRAQVTGSLFFRSVKQVAGGIDLSALHVASLCDDAESWAPAAGQLVLDGFTYGQLIGAPTDAATRIAWLDRQRPDHLGKDFKPQPWEQLIAVLRTMGHPNEARAVAVEKQARLRKAGRLPRGARPFHWLYGALVGYGYRPLRLVGVTAAVWLLCAFAYWAATNPASIGTETYFLAPPDPPPGAAVPPPDYANFVPLIYSADVLLPVVDFDYKDEWQPVVANRQGKPLFWGRMLRFLYWFEIAFGWIAGLLLVGVLGSLIKKD